MFKINFTKLVQWLLPSFLRNANLVIFVMAANKGLRDSYDKFLVYRDSALYRLNHNSQVCYLQAVLNDYFDQVLRRIRITDFSSYGATYVWVDTDSDSTHWKFVSETESIYFYNDDVGIDFSVQVPKDKFTDSSSMAHLKALVNYYKLAGKQYSIVVNG